MGRTAAAPAAPKAAPARGGHAPARGKAAHAPARGKRAHTVARPNAARAKAARTKAARTKEAPARHSARRPPATTRRAPAARRVSGPGSAAVALPVRVVHAPFARAARRRTGEVLDALLSGRGWIALVFVLLAGIVFFNVDLLQMNRDIARNDQKISALKREIARNRLDVARLASTERIQESAAQLGLVQPAPGQVRYLRAHPRRDAHLAAKRVTAPNLAYVPPEPIDTAPEPVDTTVTDPAAADPSTTTQAAPTDPASADPAAADPAAADPAAADQAAAPAPATTSTPAG